MLLQDENYARSAEVWAIELPPAAAVGHVFAEELYLGPSYAGSDCRIPAALRQSFRVAAVKLVDAGALSPELGAALHLEVLLGTSSMSVWHGLTVVLGFVLFFPYP